MGDPNMRPEVVICKWLQEIYPKESKLVLLKCAQSVHELIAETEVGGDTYNHIVSEIRDFITTNEPKFNEIVQCVSSKFGFTPKSTKIIPNNNTNISANSENEEREGAKDSISIRQPQTSLPTENKSKKTPRKRDKHRDKNNDIAKNNEKEIAKSNDKRNTNEKEKEKKAKKVHNIGVLRGSVIFIHEKEGYGFIKVKGKKDDYHFRVGEIYGDVEVKPKDTVEFQLQKLGNKIKAILVKPVKCHFRSDKEILEYLEGVKNEIKAIESNDDPFEQKDPFLSICTVPAFWNYILAQHTLHSAAVYSVLTLHELFTTSSTPHINRLKQFCASYDNKPFVHSVLPVWVEEEIKCGNLFLKEVIDGSDSMQRRLLHFIRSYLSHCAPSSTSAIFPLFEKLKEFSGSGTFFLDMMQYMIPRCQEITAVTKWSEMPLVLLPNEYFISDIAPADVPFVKSTGPYASVEEYFNTYFRLLREDCFFEMRQGISDMLEGKKTMMNSFCNIRFSGIHFLQRGRGVCYCLQFTPLRPVKNWRETSQLQYGNLLCISIDGTFKQPIWAMVHMQRKEETVKLLQSGKVFVKLCYDFNEHDDISVLNAFLMCDMKKSVMVESPVFYMSYQSTLRELKKKTKESLPFITEFVNVQTPLDPLPAYIDRNTTKVDWTIVNKKTKLKSFADIDEVLLDADILDASQVSAVKHALTNRVALIQGPPGTGKSFVGVTLVRLILSMRPTPIGPILVMTYKNHALDQFLSDCKKYFPKGVVRVGSGYEEASIALDTLFQAHLQEKHDKRKEFFQNQQKLELIKGQLEELLVTLQKLAVEDLSHFDLNMLLENATKTQIRSLLAKAPSHISSKAKSLIHYFDQAYVLENIQSPQDDDFKKLLDLLDSALNEWRPLSADFPPEPRNQSFPQDSTFPEEYPEIIPSREEELSMDDVMEVEHDRAVQEDLDEEDWESHDYYNFHFSTSEPNKVVVQVENLWMLDDAARASFIRTKLKLCKKEAQDQFQVLIQEYQKICNESEDTNNSLKVEILKRAKVIGFTITGGAIYSSLIAAVKPSVIIIEEAGEVLEAQLIAAINSNTQHIIMIGDHQQLRPPVNSYHLAKNHKFDISLLERLINNKLPYETLHSQSRMREEFVPLLHGFYPKLRSNTAVVSARLPPACMKHSLYFWTYPAVPMSLETKTNGTSVSNIFEAKMAVNLALWLLWNDKVPGKVTILTPYQGQVSAIKKLLQQFRNGPSEFLENVRQIPVHSVDRFQGDENEKIVLSLVRHNKENKLGFSAIPNRICVALSRAQCGLYVIGQGNFFSHNSPEWKSIISHFKKTEKIGNKIGVQCPRHPARHWEIASSLELEKVFLCDEECRAKLPCGHACVASCHAGPHATCTVREVVVLACGHTCKRPCAVSSDLLECKAICGKILACGHTCSLLCSEVCDPKHCEVCNTALREQHLMQKQKRKEERERVIKEAQAEAQRVRELYAKSPTPTTCEVTDPHILHHISDLVTKFIQPIHGCALRVKRVDEIRHPELHHAWAAMRAELVDPVAEYRALFHGTTKEGIEGITKEGFRLPPEGKGLMFGRGVYFATDSSKSAQELYVKGSNTLLLCHVWLGRAKAVNTAQPNLDLAQMKRLGYDSIYAERDTKSTGGVYYDEFVVYNTKQALPKYIITFERITQMDAVQLAFNSLTSDYHEREILQSRDFTASDDDVHFRIAEAQFLRMIQPQKAKVEKVTLIQNATLIEKFKKKANALLTKNGVESRIVLAFHGTEESNIPSICKQNFLMAKVGSSNGTAYGAGIYFSEKSINSHSYVRGTNKMLLCKLLLGNEHHITAGTQGYSGARLQKGFDCHNVDDGSMIVIYDPDQVLPFFVIQYSLVY